MSKSYVYKLCCNDCSVEDIYVGSTNNLKGRRYNHSSDSKNKNNGMPRLYNKMNESGGWLNWQLVVLEEFDYIDKNHTRTKEREWFEKLKPVLNTKLPIRTEEEEKKYDADYQKVYMPKYEEKNKDKLKQYRKEWYQENREKKLQYDKEYREENPRPRGNCDICGKEMRKDLIKRHKTTHK